MNNYAYKSRNTNDDLSYSCWKWKLGTTLVKGNYLDENLNTRGNDCGIYIEDNNTGNILIDSNIIKNITTLEYILKVNNTGNILIDFNIT